jgi:hypothetical protein
MKLSRSAYPLMFGVILFGLIRIIINSFSEELHDKTFLLLLAISSILILISLILAIKDKELIKTITDERTKKVDRLAGYYSWWFTVFFIFIFGIIAYVYTLTILQFVLIVITEMFLTLAILHMYFNFKGNS